MVVINTNRAWNMGYPDVNMVPSKSSCGCNVGLENHRGPFIGLQGVPTVSGLLAVAAVFATISFLNKITKNKHLV